MEEAKGKYYLLYDSTSMKCLVKVSPESQRADL